MSVYTDDDPRRDTLGRTVTEVVEEGTHKRISWPAIFAGVIIAIAIQLVLSVLGVGVGLGLVSPGAHDTPGAGSFGIGAGLWWLLSNYLALAAGGYVAAWLAGITLRFDGALHGLVTWGITLLITFYLLSSAVGGIIGGAFGLVGSAASAAGEGLKAATPGIAASVGITPDQAGAVAQSYLQPSQPDVANLSREDAQKEIAADLPKLAMSGDQATQARERIISVMAAQLKISHDDAAKRFDEVQAQVKQAADEAVATAKAAADKTAHVASMASVLACVALILGAVAAAFGGSIGVQHRAAAYRTVRVGRTAG